MSENDVPGYPGLYRRNGSPVWYVRKKVPADLRDVYMQEQRGFQLRRSLKTPDRKKALQLYATTLAEFDREFAFKRSELGSKDRITQTLTTGRLERLSEVEIDALVWAWWVDRAKLRRPEVDESEIDETLAIIAADLDAVTTEAPEEDDPAKSVADRLLVNAGMIARPQKIGMITTASKSPVINKTTEHYRYLCMRVRTALEIETKLARDHLTGERSAPSDQQLNPASGRPTRSSGISMRRNLGQLIDAYRGERVSLFGEESTARKFGLLFKVMEEVLGRDLPVDEITRQRCVELLAFLQVLPPNATKKFRNMSLKAAREVAVRDKLPGLAPKTVGTYMQNLAAVLNWAEDSGWDVSVKMKRLIRTREAKTQRRGFTPDELSMVFSALKLLRETRPTPFWVSALAAYTGARAGEICQLQKEDVVEVGGYWCLNLTVFDAKGRRVPGKRLKTASSERFVPLHPELLSSGFLKFVEGGKAGERLFPDLLRGPSGGYTHGFSKWYGRFLTKVGLPDPCLVFHSFRHGFRDVCRDAEIGDETSMALGGWTAITQATRYGDRKRVPVLGRAIQKLGYEDFRLTAV